jgi:hypothetical protein
VSVLLGVLDPQLVCSRLYVNCILGLDSYISSSVGLDICVGAREPRLLDDAISSDEVLIESPTSEAGELLCTRFTQLRVGRFTF